MSNWPNDNNANRFKKTYFNGNVDISGGALIMEPDCNINILDSNIDITKGKLKTTGLFIEDNKLTGIDTLDVSASILVQSPCYLNDDTFIVNEYRYNQNFASFSKPLIIEQGATNIFGDVGLSVNTTDAIQLPSGNSSQRPAGVPGQIRYNNTSGTIEAYIPSKWIAMSVNLMDSDLDTFINAEDGIDNDELKFYTGGGTPGVPKMVLDPIGNLGIGFQNLSYKLSVNGDIYSPNILHISNVKSSNFNKKITFDDDVLFNKDVNFAQNFSVDESFSILDLTIDKNANVTTTDRDISFFPRVDNNNGAVNIKGRLNVDGSIQATGEFITINTNVNITDQLDISNNGTGPAVIARQHGSHDIAEFYDDNNIAFIIKNGGNIGINKSNPVCKLDILSTDAIRVPVGRTVDRPIQLENGFIRYNTNNLCFEGFSDGWISLNGVIDSNKDTYIKAEDSAGANNDEIKFYVRDNLKANINTIGLGVNVTSPIYPLHVNGEIHSDQIISVDNLSIQSNSIITSTSDIHLRPRGSNSNIGDVVIQGSLSIRGNFNVIGEFNITEEKLLVSDQININNQGTSTAIICNQSGGYDIAEFYDDNNLSFIIKNGGNIGIGTFYPDEKLTLNGDMKFINYDSKQPKIHFDISRNFPVNTIHIDQTFIDNYPNGMVLKDIDTVIFQSTTLNIPNAFILKIVVDNTTVDCNDATLNFVSGNGSLFKIEDVNITFKNININGENTVFIHKDSYAYNKTISFINCNQYSSKHFISDSFHFGTNFGNTISISDVDFPYPNINFIKIIGNKEAFVGIDKDLSIYTWGNRLYGGEHNISSNANTYFSDLFYNEKAFVAKKIDNTISVWGDSTYGGDLPVEYQNYKFSQIASILNEDFGAFAGLTEDNKIYSWGNFLNIDLTFNTQNQNFIFLTSNYGSFAALKNNGSIHTWGYSGVSYSFGQNIPSSIENNNNFISITPNGYNTGGAFAAIHNNGSIYAWGNISFGGIGYIDPGAGRTFTSVAGSSGAFAALKDDGSIFAWGSNFHGGELPVDTPPSSSGYVKIFGNGNVFGGSFVALHSDGHLYFWGDSSYFSSDLIHDNKATGIFTKVVPITKAYSCLDNEGNVLFFGDFELGDNLSLGTGYTEIFSNKNNSFLVSNAKNNFDNTSFTFEYCNLEPTSKTLDIYNGAIFPYGSLQNSNINVSVTNCDFKLTSMNSISYMIFGKDSLLNGNIDLDIQNSNFSSNSETGILIGESISGNIVINNFYHNLNSIHINIPQIQITNQNSNPLTITKPSIEIINFLNNGSNLILEYEGSDLNNPDYFSFYSQIDDWSNKGESLNIVPSNGRVGIGITNPTRELDVNGDISCKNLYVDNVIINGQSSQSNIIATSSTNISHFFNLQIDNINNNLFKRHLSFMQKSVIDNINIVFDDIFLYQVLFKIDIKNKTTLDSDKSIIMPFVNSKYPGLVVNQKLEGFNFDPENQVVVFSNVSGFTNHLPISAMVTIEFKY